MIFSVRFVRDIISFLTTTTKVSKDQRRVKDFFLKWYRKDKYIPKREGGGALINAPKVSPKTKFTSVDDPSPLFFTSIKKEGTDHGH